MDIKLPKTNDDDIKDIQEDFENDLISFYKILQDEIIDIIDKNNDKSFEDIIHEIQKLFS